MEGRDALACRKDAAAHNGEQRIAVNARGHYGKRLTSLYCRDGQARPLYSEQAWPLYSGQAWPLYSGHRIGELSTTEAMLMTPAAIAAELARIDQTMHAFDSDLSNAVRATAQAHGYPMLELIPGTSARDQIQAISDYLKVRAKALGAKKATPDADDVVTLY